MGEELASANLRLSSFGQERSYFSKTLHDTARGSKRTDGDTLHWWSRRVRMTETPPSRLPLG